MATEHPKVTAYIPKEILRALDDWKQEKEIDSRSSAIVAIVADYLGVPYPVASKSTAPLNTVLSGVKDELEQLKERVAMLEQVISRVPKEVPSTVLVALSDPTPSDVPSTAMSDTPIEAASSPDAVLNKVTSTAPSPAVPFQAPLSQSALAKRLGCSDKAISLQRKYGSKENFAAWSRERDPDHLGWTWAGRAMRGQPLRFIPAT